MRSSEPITMRFVPAKTTQQQTALLLVGMRERLAVAQTHLVSAIRGDAAECWRTAVKGVSHVPIPLNAS